MPEQKIASSKAPVKAAPVEDAPSEEHIVEFNEPEPTRATEPSAGPQVVRAVTGESVTLPSGASFAFSAGQTYTVSPEDAKVLIESGAAVAAE